jgi:hypothetical protein
MHFQKKFMSKTASIPVYAAIVDPATVENPASMTANNSDTVISSKNGRTSNGASA